MGFDLVKMTVSAKRHLPTPFGNKDAFYSESMEIPSESEADRSCIHAFLCQRLDLTYLLDYYTSVHSSDGCLPNSELWPFIEARIEALKKLHSLFPGEIQRVLAFYPDFYRSMK